MPFSSGIGLDDRQGRAYVPWSLEQTRPFARRAPKLRNAAATSPAPLKIAFIGADSGNARLLRLALGRLGRQVTAVDPYAAIQGHTLRRWSWHTGNLFLKDRITRHVQAALAEGAYDVGIVDSGDMVPVEVARWLAGICSRTILFCRDNPFVDRDGNRWRLLKPALRHYDLFVTRRESSIAPALELGARNVDCILLPADEIEHRPIQLTQEERTRFTAEVSFVGTWMPERGPFVETLLRRGVPLRVFGSRWNKARNFDAIRPAVALGWLATADYSKAVAASRISIGLLSRGNADLHTARSVEIPAIGRLLCAERTTEHVRMFRENEEAVFWSDAEECADVCLALLADPDRIERIAAAGRRRLVEDGRYNEPTWTGLLAKAMALPRQDRRVA